MTKTEFDQLTAGRTPRSDREFWLSQARTFRNDEESAYKARSGSDVAEAPCWGMLADACGCIAEGADVAAAVALFDAKWRKYAKEQIARVAAAPKLANSPGIGRGYSTLHHRWVSEDLFMRRQSQYVQLAPVRPAVERYTPGKVEPKVEPKPKAGALLLPFPRRRI